LNCWIGRLIQPNQSISSFLSSFASFIVLFLWRSRSSSLLKRLFHFTSRKERQREKKSMSYPPSNVKSIRKNNSFYCYYSDPKWMNEWMNEFPNCRLQILIEFYIHRFWFHFSFLISHFSLFLLFLLSFPFTFTFTFLSFLRCAIRRCDLLLIRHWNSLILSNNLIWEAILSLWFAFPFIFLILFLFFSFFSFFSFFLSSKNIN